MTTPDIAGLCERLWVGCIYMRDSNTNCVVDPEKTDALLTKAADTLDRQAVEIERLRGVLSAAEAWIDRWSYHVGSCRGATNVCTCGRTFVLYEIRAALTGEG